VVHVHRTAQLLAIILPIGMTTPVAAQVSVGASAGAFSDYVWRGLTLTNQPVIQPSLTVGVPVSGATITVGGWANIEPVEYDDPSEISQGGGLAGPDLTEFDWWAEYARTSGIVKYAAGVLGYVFPNDAGFTEDFNTIELYGRLGLDRPLSPLVAAWYDLDEVQGAYIETSLSYSVPLTESLALGLGALAGWSAGHGPNEGDANELFNYTDDGLTHVDLSASTSFAAGPVSIAPTFHFVIAGDDNVEITEPGETDDTKIWFGAVLSWAREFGGPKVDESLPGEP
jgi:hypothetical protein